MPLDAVTGEDLEDLVDDLADLRHDLGKYITFEVRFLEDPATDDDLRAALRRDLLETRRGAAGTEPAWDVWARLRPARLDGDPDVAALDDLLARLRDADLDGPRATLDAAADLAREVAATTRRLHRRALDRLDD